MKKIRRILLSSFFLMPMILVSVCYSLYLHISEIQSTPISSWVAILVLTVYCMIKIDLKKLLENTDGAGKDSE